VKKLALVLLCIAPAVGCFSIKPVGPLAKSMGKPGVDVSPEPGVTVTAAKDAPAGPMVQPAPAPPPPSLRVTPGEVNDTNYNDAARRLVEELEADRKAMESMPRYAEVSVVPGSR